MTGINGGQSSQDVAGRYLNRLEGPSAAPNAPSEAAAAPQDRVTLNSESEAYQRRSTREIYQALRQLGNPSPPPPEGRPLSEAERQRALQGMQNMINQNLQQHVRDLGSH